MMEQITMKKGSWVKVVKLSDDKFNGLHPNYIDEGYTRFGELCHDIEVGKRLEMSGKRLHDWFTTSIVTEIIDNNTFKTENSTYKIEDAIQSFKMDDDRIIINLED